MPLCHCATVPRSSNTQLRIASPLVVGVESFVIGLLLFITGHQSITQGALSHLTTLGASLTTLSSQMYIFAVHAPPEMIGGLKSSMTESIACSLAPLGGGAVYTRVKDNNTDNKKRKHKGGSGLRTVPPRGNASRRFWVWRGRSEHAVGSLSSCI